MPVTLDMSKSVPLDQGGVTLDMSKSVPLESQPAPAAPRSALSRFLVPDDQQEQTYKDMTKGLGETLAQNVASVNGAISRIPGVGHILAPSEGIQKFQDLATPTNDAQRTGKTIGNVAENVGASLIPGVAEAGVLPRIAMQGVTQGLTSKAQGNDWETAGLDVLGGAAGEGIGSLLGKFAPTFMKMGAKLSGPDAIDTAKALLEHTNSYTPAGINDEVTGLVRRLGTENKALVNGQFVDLNPAADKAVDVASDFSPHGKTNQNAVLGRIMDPFGAHPDLSQVPGELALKTRRDLGALGNYSVLSPTEDVAVSKASKPVYGEVTKAIHGLPGVGEQITANDDLMSRVLPALSDTARADLKPGLMDALASRATHPVSLAGIGGGMVGGPLGAVGATVAADALKSPAASVVASRALHAAPRYSPKVAAALLGLLNEGGPLGRVDVETGTSKGSK
jgi:hypothetical protein